MRKPVQDIFFGACFLFGYGTVGGNTDLTQMGRILVIFFVTVIVIIGVNSFVSLCNIGKESERFEINLINTLTAFGKGDQDGSDG